MPLVVGLGSRDHGLNAPPPSTPCRPPLFVLTPLATHARPHNAHTATQLVACMPPPNLPNSQDITTSVSSHHRTISATHQMRIEG